MACLGRGMTYSLGNYSFPLFLNINLIMLLYSEPISNTRSHRMRLYSIIFTLFIGLFAMNSSAQACQSQAVTSYSGGVVVIDNYTTSLTRAETAILTENILASQSIRVLNKNKSVAFSFANHQDAVKFTKLLYTQHLDSLSRPGQLKRVQEQGKYFRVYLSNPQYIQYKKNILSQIKSRQANIGTVYQINNSVPTKHSHSAKKKKIIVVKARPTRPVNKTKPKRKKNVVYLHKTNHKPSLKLKTTFPVNSNKSHLSATFAI